MNEVESLALKNRKEHPDNESIDANQQCIKRHYGNRLQTL
jgi:hypothetical protein